MFNFIKTIFRIMRHPLNSRFKALTLIKIVKWQIGSRILQKPIITSWINDSLIGCSNGEVGLTGNLYCGLIEFEEMGFLLHVLRSNHLFIDVGANAGAYTILASKVVGCKVVSYEPINETYNRLLLQIKINGVSDLCNIKKSGVGQKKGTLKFTNNLDSINKVCNEEHENRTSTIDVVDLDSDVFVSVPCLLKIDVEGYEFKVLTGAFNILKSEYVYGVIIEMNGCSQSYGNSDSEIHGLLVSLGFIPIQYNPFSRILTKLEVWNTENDNTIYVKNIDWINKLCQNAEKRIIHTAHSQTI